MCLWDTKIGGTPKLVSWSHKCPWKAITQIFPDLISFNGMMVRDGIKSLVFRKIYDRRISFKQSIS